MIQGSTNAGGVYINVKGVQQKGIMDGKLKDSINRNAERSLPFLSPGDAIDLAMQTQGVHGVADQTQAILQENEALRKEQEELRASNNAHSDNHDLQHQKINRLEEENAKLRTQVGA